MGRRCGTARAPLCGSLGLPVAASFRRQDYFDNDSPCFVGDVGIGINPALAQRVKDADVLLVLGARLGEMPTQGYSLLDIPKPKQQLIHVHASVEELGRVYQPDLAINAGPGAFAARRLRTLILSIARSGAVGGTMRGKPTKPGRLRRARRARCKWEM